MNPYVMIKVNGEDWAVPRGFGRIYAHTARQFSRWLGAGDARRVVRHVSDAMGLVGYDVASGALLKWTVRQCVEAYIFAVYEYANASDNPVRRHPRPGWLPEPWRGPAWGRGAFAGPGPTPLGAPPCAG